MGSAYWGLLAVHLSTLLPASWPLGIWLAHISSGTLPAWTQRFLAPLYCLAGTSSDKSMNW